MEFTAPFRNSGSRPVEDFLRGCVNYPVTDVALRTLLEKRGVSAGVTTDLLTRKDRELLEADLLVWCAGGVTTTGSVEDADGTWKHKEGSVQLSVTDKKELLRRASVIYRKYGETVPGVGSGIRLSAKGIKLWR